MSKYDNDHRGADHLRRLADRCEAGAAELQRTADDPARVLAERGYHDYADAQEWGQRKQSAATAAREYAAALRAEADALGEGERPSPERIDQAEKVATAAECDGILIDGRPLAEAGATNPWNSPEAQQAIRDHDQAERDAVEGSGLFEHVAEDGQVPYWQLGGTSSTNTNDTGSAGGDQRAVGNEETATSAGGPAGWNVGVSATGGETVDVDGDVVGGYGGYGGSARGAERSDRAGGGSGGTNIGVVQSGSGKVNVGGAVTGQQVTYNSGGPAASTPASNAGSQAAADDCDGM